MLKLIATDMDGTFLKDDMTYNEAQFTLLYQQLQLRGIRFVIASGNQYAQLKSFFKDYPDMLYLAENGAYCRDANQVYVQQTFTPASVHAILQQLRAIADLQLIVCGVKGAYALTSMPAEHVATMRHYYHQLTLVSDFATVDDAILKFAISCPPAKTTAIVNGLRTALTGLGEPTSSGHGDIDIIQPGMNKAAGLKALGQQLGIDLTEMAAFGAGGNDLEMLREVGQGIAMANATPAVRAVANQITTSNQQQGVLTAMAAMLND